MGWTTERARVAAAAQHHPDDHEAIAAARADLAAEKLAPLDQPPTVTPGFNPRRVQEWVRTCVAAATVGAVIAETLILTIAYVSGGISAKDLPQVTSCLITPLVGIAGTILGFYFGSHRPNGGPEA